MKSNNKILLILGIVIIILVTVSLTKVLTSSKSQKEDYSKIYYDLSTLSDNMDEYCMLIEDDKLDEALMCLGEIRNGSFEMATSEVIQKYTDNRSLMTIGSVVSEIWALSDIENYGNDMKIELTSIYEEYNRIKKPLEVRYSIQGSHKEAIDVLGERLERDLELRYPVE